MPAFSSPHPLGGEGKRRNLPRMALIVLAIAGNWTNWRASGIVAPFLARRTVYGDHSAVARAEFKFNWAA